MKNLFLLFLLAVSLTSQSQYYYKHILGTRETNQLIKQLLDNNVRSISLTSYEEDGSLTEGFRVRQELHKEPLSLRTITRSGDDEDDKVLVSFFDKELRLVQTIDSSGSLPAYTSYTYDGSEKLNEVRTWSVDSTGNKLAEEVHKWYYQPGGELARLERLKSGVLVEEIRFKYSDGLLTEEQVWKNGKLTSTLFYYYNNSNLLTDVVRFNERAGRLLPDYMFEYSEKGQLLQKVTVPSNSSEYLIWRYLYDSRGLKIKEALYNKYKQLVARIDYTYSFYQ